MSHHGESGLGRLDDAPNFSLERLTCIPLPGNSRMKRRTWLCLVCLVLTSAAAASAVPMYHLTTLVSFDYANGAFPDAGLIADASGNLFGTTRKGGDLTLDGGLGGGTVFEMAVGTHSITTLATFHGANGRGPNAGLLADASGNLYGTTTGGNGGGTVFELSPVPEPSAFVLTALGVFGFVMSRLRRACFARRFNLCVVLVSVAALQQAQTVAHAAAVRTVALSGQQAPGTASGVSYSDFGLSALPVLNDAGQTAFYARLSGGGVDSTNGEGIWSEGSGNLSLVARAGVKPPARPAA